MLCGNAPFYGQSLSTEEIMERIRAGQFSFDAPEWSRVSRTAKSIIEGTHICATIMCMWMSHGCHMFLQHVTLKLGVVLRRVHVSEECDDCVYTKAYNFSLH